MKVGTQITAATSALVAVTLGIYTGFDLRDGAEWRRSQMERQCQELAAALRASLEAPGPGPASGTGELSKRLSRALPGWEITVLPLAALQRGPEPALADALGRLRTLREVRPSFVATDLGDRYVLTLPLRTPSPNSPEGFEVTGSIEVSRHLGYLRSAWLADVGRSLTVLGGIVALTTAAIWLLTRRLVSAPITKLIAGIDDVAHGDLSHVLLSEREDEIGALASRFNEMTFSLRESRAETQRQNETRTHLEQRLFETEKLATIGQLAAEIAHEVGTPLSVIAGRARSLGRKAGEPEVIRKNAAIIAEQTARITRIIERLLDFTRRKVGVVQNRPVNLNEVTLTTMDFLEQKLAAARVRSTLTRAEGLPPVRGNADQLQQVLLNLLVNAVQAMPEGGILRLETLVIVRRRPGLEVAPERPYVLVEVSDTGVGIPRDQREEIFAPFYTSRAGDGGTGLGLAVSYGIIKEHDGWIEVDDAPGGGTVFRVFLPALELDGPAARAPQHEEPRGQS
jgi:signal transduction histidine kinase